MNRGLICVIIWNNKFVQLNYMSNEAVDKMMAFYRMFPPSTQTEKGKEDGDGKHTAEK